MLNADNTRYADADLITLTNNGMLHLFSSLKITLAGETVEYINYPGQATSFLGLPSYSTTISYGCGLTEVGIQIPKLKQLLIIMDLIHDRDTWYDIPIQKVAFNVPFQWGTYSVLWMTIQR